LFSANLAFHVLRVVAARSHYPVLYLGQGLLSVLYRIFPVPAAVREADLNQQYFLVLVLALTVMAFAILRIASGLSLSDIFLRHAAGVAGVAAFPLATRYSGGLLLAAPYWLPFEILAAVILAVLYQLGSLRRNSRLMLLLLAAHFVLWGWATGPSWFWPVLPILGFGATLMWAIYLQHFPAAKGNVSAVPK